MNLLILLHPYPSRCKTQHFLHTNFLHCMSLNLKYSVTDLGSCFFEPWIWDPGWKKFRSSIRDEHPGSYFWDFSMSFLGNKNLNSLMRIRIRDLVNPESGMEKKSDPGSAILIAYSHTLKFPMRTFLGNWNSPRMEGWKEQRILSYRLQKSLYLLQTERTLWDTE